MIPTIDTYSTDIAVYIVTLERNAFARYQKLILFNASISE